MLAEYMGWPYIFYLFGMSKKVDEKNCFASKYQRSRAFLQVNPIQAVWQTLSRLIRPSSGQ
jgi:hypothetical protein